MDISKEFGAIPVTNVVYIYIYLRYITLESVTLRSQRTLIHKLIILVCLVCWHAVLSRLIRSARN